MDNSTPVENRENPLFGRKIIFVNPPIVIENSIFSQLREEEYEVYIIKDYHFLKPVLRENKDALVFLYIDDQLTYDQWFNYIKSYEVDEGLNTIFFGVLSSKATFEEQQRYIMDLKLPGGFLMLNERAESLFKKLKAILDLNGAKGRRQYIRLDCKTLDSVNGYFTCKDKLYSFSVDNISSVGFACVYPIEMAVLLQKNTLQPTICLSVGRKNIVAPSVVFDTRLLNGKGFSVFLFTKDVPRETKVSIRNFIFQVMDENFNSSVSNSIQDMTDYSEKIKVENEAVPEFEEIQDSFIGILDGELPEMDDV